MSIHRSEIDGSIKQVPKITYAVSKWIKEVPNITTPKQNTRRAEVEF